jgi:hypothetical protein
LTDRWTRVWCRCRDRARALYLSLSLIGRSRFFPLFGARFYLALGRLENAFNERLESLCSASAFRGVTCQSREGLLSRLSFLSHLRCRCGAGRNLRAAVVISIVMLPIICPSQIVLQIGAKDCPMGTTKYVLVDELSRYEKCLGAFRGLPLLQLSLSNLHYVVGRSTKDICRLLFCSVGGKNRTARSCPISIVVASKTWRNLYRKIGRNILSVGDHSKLFCKCPSRICSRHSYGEGLSFGWRSNNLSNCYPSALIEMGSLSSKFYTPFGCVRTFLSGVSRFPHLGKLTTQYLSLVTHCLPLQKGKNAIGRTDNETVCQVYYYP